MPDKEPEELLVMRRLVDMTAQLTYENAERTLTLWIRTALGFMILGFVIDRLNLFLVEFPAGSWRTGVFSNAFLTWLGVALVAAGVATAAATGLRFLAYAAAYRRQQPLPLRGGRTLGPFYALMTTVFGMATLIILLIFSG
jgi:uncharacterized membrane protein YidH (DUF202 family)